MLVRHVVAAGPAAVDVANLPPARGARRHPALLFLLVLSASGSGCIGSCERDTTLGELGQARFEWDDCSNIPYESCPLDESVAVGSVASIVVYNLADLPSFTVGSSDPAVATFEWDGTTIRMDALSAGTAKLELYRTTDGTVLDRVALDVADVADVGMVWPETDWTLALMPGGPVTVRFEPLDADGAGLVGTGALTFAAGAGLSIDSTSTPGDRFEEVGFQATAAGHSTLRVTAGAGSRELSLSVPRPDEVDRVAFAEERETFRHDGPGSYFYLWAEATLSDGSVVYRPQCTWSTSDAGCITIEGDGVLDATDGCETKIIGHRLNCRAVVTAAVGTVSDSIVVETR
jgi:hypothetical protein